VCIALLAGCSCEEDREDLAAEGRVRCHMAAPPDGERRVGGRVLRFEDRTLTIEGLGETVRVAVAAGPLGRELPDADLLIVLGGLEAPIPESRAIVLAIAGADDWERWSRNVRVDTDTRPGVIDATRLRLVRAGPLELVPVAGAPVRYAPTDGACGLTAEEADEWSLEPPPAGVSRVLAGFAAPEAAGLLGLPAGAPAVAAIRDRAHASAAVFAWPREDPRAVRPAVGPWIVRADGSRDAPGWTLFEATARGWARLDSARAAD
jgi:hypothetical protein